MLVAGTVAVYRENYMEHTDALCGQNANSARVKANGINNNLRASNDESIHQ
jgi:hypothetical protein